MQSNRSAIQCFAEKYNLRLERDICNDPVIEGSRGQVYEYGPGSLGLIIISPDNEPRPRLWNLVRELCLQAGMTLRQNGDGEGSLSFDPENEEHGRLAIKSAGIRPKRRISEEHKAKLLAGLKASQNRSEAILEGGSSC